MRHRLYLQCPMGHYSAGGSGCWFHSWYPDVDAEELDEYLAGAQDMIRLSSLVGAQLPVALASRAVLMTFGAEESSFEGMIPLGFSQKDGPHAVPWNPGFPKGFDTVDGTRPVLYLRCNGGHYFTDSDQCPHDAWSLDGFARVRQRFATKVAVGTLPRPDQIIPKRGSEQVLRRIVIAQFGDPACAFRGVVPMIYCYRGATYRAEEEAPLALL